MDVSELPKANQESRSEKSINGFLGIFSDLFHQPGSPTLDEFGLYSKADLDTFLAGIPKQEAEYYKYLAKTIISSHNVNYWSQQPNSIENLQRSIAVFQQDYNSSFFSDPAILKGQDFYEAALRQIQSENGGFVPKSKIEYKGDSASYWDKVVKAAFLRSGIEWRTKNISSEADFYLTLGKAIGNASKKYAEIINEKPGLVGRLISAVKSKLPHPFKQPGLPQLQPVMTPAS